MKRFSRLSIAAVALLAAHALLIATLGSGATGNLASDLTQAAVAALACFACYHQGSKARNPARAFWWLVASWCALWTAGQCLSAYTGYVVSGPHSTAPQFLTFFFCVAPLFMALFLISESTPQQLEWDDLLDGLQVLVVIAAAYLFFIYIPGKVRGEGEYLALRLEVLNVRNLLLVAGLAVRAAYTRSSVIRALFWRLAVVMAVYTVGTGLGNRAEEVWRVQGNWFDLAWSLPFAMVAIAAATWSDVSAGHAQRPASRKIIGPVIIYSVPLLLPLLLLRGEAIRAKLIVAAAAVAASFVCFAARLLVVQYRERRALEDLARMEERLRQAQKLEAIGTLAGGVAHDFNNLLTVITGYSDLVLSSLAPGSADHKWVEEIHRASKRGADLVRQLLAFSRRQILQPKILDLNQVVAGMRDMLQRLIGEQVQISLHLAAQLPPVQADPGKIEQVIMNLAVNARDAMPAGGRLAISTRKAVIGQDPKTVAQPAIEPGTYAVLSVKDTGVGMDAATQARIFEPFFTTKEMGRGTGLGLSTVYGIVRQSGGWIEVQSAAGTGAEFEVYLPQAVQQEDLPAQPGPSATTAPPSRAGGETLLLLEDDAEIRHLAKRILEMNSYRVLVAASGAEAEKLNLEHPGEIDLMISDVVVPGSDGPALVRNLQARRPAMRALYISGYTRDKIVEKGVLIPGVEFLQKPFSPEELAAKVREVLADSGPRPVRSARAATSA